MCVCGCVCLCIGVGVLSEHLGKKGEVKTEPREDVTFQILLAFQDY